MTEFLKVLSLYYMCDAAAAMRPLSPEEVEGCVRSYETVKLYFSGLEDGAPMTVAEQVARKRSAYLGFKSWEVENAATVAEMKAQAYAAVRP